MPSSLRRKALHAWLMTLIAPAIRLHGELVAFRAAALYRLSITPQVCYLEKALNDRYDYTLRRIRILDAQVYDPIPLFLKEEEKTVHIFKKPLGVKVLYTKAETSIFAADFIIQVPYSIVFNEAEMRAFVDNYKLAGKIFKIKYL